MSRISINFLPEEMFIRVFHLLTPKDLKNVMLVCKQWKEIGEDPSLWTWALVTIEAREEIQKLNIRRFQRVQNIRVTQRYRKAEDLVGIFEALLEIPSVNRIIGLYNINLSGVESILLANVLNKADDFWIYGHGENVFNAVAKQTNLKKLGVFESRNIGPALFADAISNVEDVVLVVFGCSPEQIEALFVLITEDDRPLRKLILSSCDTIDIMPELFGAALNKLEKVTIEDKYVTSEQITAVIRKVVNGESKLQSLMFEHMDNDEVVGLDPILVSRAREKLGVFFRR